MFPPPLKKGDLIGLTATARFIDEERLELAEERLHKAGFRTKRSAHCLKPFHQFGGNDQQRAMDFQNMLDDPEVRAIFSVRGGYGTVRMIDLVDFSVFDKDPKWICGYSDITALHGRLSALGFNSLHCSMPVNFDELSEEAFDATCHILMGKWVDLAWSESAFDRSGKGRGHLLGGNLSMLYSLLGSTDFPALQGAVLFIEEIDEYIYHIDRMLRGLKRAGAFEGLEAVVVGGLTDMNDHDIPFGWSSEELIQQCFDSMDIPLAFGLPAGHIKNNMPLILGAEVLLEKIDNNWHLRYA